MPAALSRKQKAYLAQLARQAFEHLRVQARARGEVFPADHAMHGEPTDPALWCAETFRHDEVAKACHKKGLRCCSQDDYGAVKGHFLALLGREGQAMKAMVRGADNPKRTAEIKLIEALQRGGFNNGYAEAICRRQFKCSVADATAAQIWKLVYTIRNRGTEKLKEAKA
jgi:hypothetical protein